MEKESAIKITGLSLSFKNRLIFDQTNFSAKRGQITGLVGPNGSGKSVLFKIIAGFIRPHASRLIVNDHDLLASKDFPPNTGTLIEEPYFIDHLSGFENLKLLASIRNVINSQTIIDYLKEFNLPLDKEAVKNYSLGMKKKLGIIQSFMEKQSLILLDEPMNALDADSVRQTRQKLVHLVKSEQRTIVITSHNQADIETLCDRVVKIKDHQIVDFD